MDLSMDIEALAAPDGAPSAPDGARRVAAGLANVFEDCSDIVVLTDFAGRISYVNAAGEMAFGDAIAPGRSIVGPEALAVWGADGHAFELALQRLLRHPDERGTGEVTRVRGGVHVCAWRSQTVRDGVGAPVGRSFVFEDLSQARELSTLKSDFLSTVTHELRTPLTSVKGSLQLVLGKSAALAPVERELLGISLKNADRLIRLINDLLDISRLELGNLDLSFAPTATSSMVHEAVAGLRAYAGGRDVVIGCDVEANLPPVRGDRDRLLQVLTNLISNAIKFSGVGGRVAVRAHRAGDDIAIAVRDWGRGIAESDRGRLFRRFQRLHPDCASEPGTGLGLAISKAIVDRHGGRIVVESREHEGSTFTVLVPAALEAVPGAVSGRDGVPAGRRPTVLLVDDDADVGTVLAASLGEDYRLLRVERGVQALDVARAERPDLILLDVVLPDLSGYDVLRILQHSEATGAIPIVILTVQPEPTLASGLGAAEVLAKPVDIAHLRTVIDRTLAAVTDVGSRVPVGV